MLATEKQNVGSVGLAKCWILHIGVEKMRKYDVSNPLPGQLKGHFEVIYRRSAEGHEGFNQSTRPVNAVWSLNLATEKKGVLDMNCPNKLLSSFLKDRDG